VMEVQAGGLHVAVQEGVGKVEDDIIFDWLEGEPIDVKADEIDALVADSKRVQVSA
jgi:hypothetical protein